MMSRLDKEVFRRGIAISRERSAVLIKSGNISVNGKVCLKPSLNVSESDVIELSGEDLKYVGRGGLKLEKALSEFNIDLKDCLCIDIGASTGGFTDCMLQNGALKVYAVDVGHGQLAESLINNEKVINLENTDIRNLSLQDFEKPADFISIDVSFISLKQVLPHAYKFLSDDGIISALIKPQFEAGKNSIGKNGIVKDSKVHIRVLKETEEFSRSINLYSEKYTFSPISGGSGNIEYLVKFTKHCNNNCYDFSDIVKKAKEIL